MIWTWYSVRVWVEFKSFWKWKPLSLRSEEIWPPVCSAVRQPLGDPRHQVFHLLPSIGYDDLDSWKLWWSQAFWFCGALKTDFWKNLGFCPNWGGGGSANPNFLSNCSKTKFALELPINAMKYIIHSWGVYVSSILVEIRSWRDLNLKIWLSFASRNF